MPPDSWRGLRAGDQIGNLEYVVDDAALAAYRRVVGVDGCFPNLMAEDCRSMLTPLVSGGPLTTVWQKLEFLRPPILGRRVQVGGWARELAEQRGRHGIRVAAFAVDDIGTEILRTETAFVAGRDAARPDAGVEPAARTEGKTLTCSRAGDGGHLGQLRVPRAEQMRGYRNIAKAMAGVDMDTDGSGLTSVVAGWLEGLMGASFGEDFRWGGQLSIAYHGTVAPGMDLRCHGVVLGHDIDARGVKTRRVVVTVGDAGDYRVVTAEAVVESPSPRLV